MGIRQLNTFLKQMCKPAIRQISFKDLSNKKIAIDVSIYLYKFLQEGSLIDNLYLLIGLFRKYNIVPVFVFDGKPPQEKHDILEKRRQDKKNARNYYLELEKKLLLLKKHPSLKNQDEIFKIQKKMQEEYKKSIKVTFKNIQEAKKLISAYGACYLEANGEADVLCAQLVKSKLVYGCLSEDMDLFAYGCNRVYRDINIYNETMIYYDYVKILKLLKLSSKEFREICVYSGTDYSKEATSIFVTIKLFKLFKKSKETEFYEWLVKQNYIKDNIILYNVYFMFDFTETLKKIKLEFSDIQKSILDNILVKSGFLLV